MRMSCFSRLALAAFCLPMVAGIVCAAQATSQPKASAPRTTILPMSAVPDGCPLILDVRHGAGLVALHSVGTSQPTEPIEKKGMYQPDGQNLDLNITNLGPLDVASIDAVVGVDSGTARMVPVKGGKESADAELPMHLTTAVGAKKQASISWRVASTNPVLYVEIRKVTYLAGSTWGGDTSCRFTPNPLTLISSR